MAIASAVQHGRGRASTLFFTLLVGAASCSPVARENAGSCKEHHDNDGDDLTGCADSDCHRFELCRSASQLVPDAGEAGDDDGGNASTDSAGGANGVFASDENGGDGAEGDDGGAEHDAGACACRANATCVNGECVPAEEPEPSYTVRMISAQSPRGTFGPPPDGVCVDIGCRSGTGSPVSYCPCEPELYVRVIHLSDPTAPDPIEEIVLSTRIQGEMLMVTFAPDEQAEVALKPGERLRFELWDQNMTVADSMIYSCEPELHELTSGPLECSVLSGPTGVDEFWIRAELQKR